MQVLFSKTLSSLVSRMAFDAEKNNITTHLTDRLFVNALAIENSLLREVLASILKDWELQQIEMRVQRGIAKESAAELSRGEYFETLRVSLANVCGINKTAHTGHLLLLVLGDPLTVARRTLEMYGINIARVQEKLLSTATDEDADTIKILPVMRIGKEPQPKSTLLDKFGVNLTDAAKKGNIDNVVGRSKEIERLIQILGRRKKNNPILIGEAGVGKSAIVEGLALRIVAGEVPFTLRGKRVYSLDITALVAGTKYRGEFEERMRSVIDELKRADDIIVFIDEIHTIVGAGSTQGSLDTANMLKPALARGELQCIGATTLDEYRENIERDAALERRFQKIIVEPTTAEQTLAILQNIKRHYEVHHHVHYTDTALAACVELTERYITDRYFPDKAIDVMDEAGAKAHLSNTDDKNEQTIVEITESYIEQTITAMTGIPVERISQTECDRLTSLQSHLERYVIGQSEAIAKVAKSILRSRAGLKDPRKPTGVFMFVGPTGVGKTHLAKELARRMFDRNDALIRIDMSEYGEKHNVARLIGSPPGYIGYGEGGQLSEAVRRQPYSVVLFDEIEKAHPDVFNVMLQILDDGMLTDGSGRKIDFKNTVLIMTSNAGSRAASSKSSLVGYQTTATPRSESLAADSEYRKALEHTFAPEFINRIDDIVVFNTLQSEDVQTIVDLEMEALTERAAKIGLRLSLLPEARSHIASEGFEPQYGVRSLKRQILSLIEEPLAQMIVAGEVVSGDSIDIGCTDGQIKLLVKAA